MIHMKGFIEEAIKLVRNKGMKKKSLEISNILLQLTEISLLLNNLLSDSLKVFTSILLFPNNSLTISMLLFSMAICNAVFFQICQ